MNTNAIEPNYARRQLIAVVLLCLFIYFIGVPLFIFVVRVACELILLFHGVMVGWGWVA